VTNQPNPATPPTAPPEHRRPPAGTRPKRPEYRGEELDPERGPGLGCFWFQVIVLGFFIVIIPIGLNLGWPYEVLAILLFIVIGLLLLTGQTAIFLMRLVAADRRAEGRRRPLASGTRTVGEIEDELAAGASGAAATAPEAGAAPPEAGAPAPAAGAPPDETAAAPETGIRDTAGEAAGDQVTETGSPGQQQPDPGVRQ
jgi:murein DD-endopeptidase MepM/ murein hydrolase activator NlpD